MHSRLVRVAQICSAQGKHRIRIDGPFREGLHDVPVLHNFAVFKWEHTRSYDDSWGLYELRSFDTCLINHRLGAIPP